MSTQAIAAHDLQQLRKKAEAEPDNINLWVDLCEAAEIQKNYAEIVSASAQLLRLAPNKPQPHYIRGLALQNLDRLEEAVESYRCTLLYNPDYLNAWFNLAYVYQALNLLPQAEDACRQAIRISGQAIPDEDTCLFQSPKLGCYHWNLAVIELLKGDLRRGFARYPSRLEAAPPSKYRANFLEPLWRGEDLKGKTLLVTVDQGHGDTLMMIRYLPLLPQKGARVLLQAQPALMPLLKNWDGADGVYEWGRDPLPSFDFYASEFDLPRLMQTTLQTLPAQVPYLPLPAPTKATDLAPTDKLKISLTWCGNINNPDDQRRSVPLQALEPLTAQDNIQFYMLNRDKRPGDAERIAHLPVIDLLAENLDDFSAAARFVSQMDIVITCDTSIAHLAGGMGKKVWVLLPFASSWCWMAGREDSPWYPTARLFRQKKRGDWDEVITRVTDALKNVISSNS